MIIIISFNFSFYLAKALKMRDWFAQKWTDKRTDKQTDGQADGQTDMNRLTVFLLITNIFIMLASVLFCIIQGKK